MWNETNAVPLVKLMGFNIFLFPEDIKKHVDKTMAKLINPHKAKDKVIAQVSKQIHDMEKFVSFLQSK